MRFVYSRNISTYTINTKLKQIIVKRKKKFIPISYNLLPKYDYYNLTILTRKNDIIIYYCSICFIRQKTIRWKIIIFLRNINILY